MLKCPYCYERLENHPPRCPHCNQHIIDDLIDVPYPSLDKKDCVFCGKKILQEARICRHCHKWLDELNQTLEDIDWED
ncbi:MAG: hypothetical protein ACLFPX_07180 [Candidatus Omnitrophota bacterium]